MPNRLAIALPRDINIGVDAHLRVVAIWLFVCAAMIFVMIVLGGLTRLTDSGLSMVEWKPITGLLPPMNDASWQDAFAKYQQYPQFKINNPDMDIAVFKSIFWLEFVHRIWGRLIGIVFLIPLLYFWLRGHLDRILAAKMFTLFIIGGLQGALGWFMVRSGLIDKPDVSQYRLVAHLLLAFLLYGYTVWFAMTLLWPKPHLFFKSMRKYGYACSGLIMLLVITVISGGFVAGTNAGLIYNTFPLMGDTLLPPSLLILELGIKNLFENVVTIQFVHRLLTGFIFIAFLIFYFRLVFETLPRRTYIALHSLLVIVTVQFILGVLTLLQVVPVMVAATHQAGALLLWTVVLWLRHELRV